MLKEIEKSKFLIENNYKTSNNNPSNDIVNNNSVQIKLYRRRWINLIIFILLQAVNAGQWIQYSIIANITMRYYNISARMVDNTSLIYLITYLPLMFPFSYLMEKLGLKFTLVAAAFGNCIGSWLKVPSVNPNLFYLGFLGQAVLSCTQVLLLSQPPRFAAIWFNAERVSTACSLGVFGQQLGMSIGFILTPLVVQNHWNVDDIGNDFYRLFLGMAIFTTVILVATIVVCEKQPPLPPSQAQALLRMNKLKFSNRQVIDSFKRLLKDKNVWLMLLAFGINIGVLNAVATFLNQMILVYFPGNQLLAGQVGLIMIVAGIGGSVIFGYILDKTRKYKETTLLVYLLTAVGMFAFTYSLGTYSQTLILICAAGLGCFMTGYIPVSFEYTAELTFPESESNSSGLLVATSQTTGVIFVLLFGYILEQYGDLWCNLGMCTLLVIGTILTGFVSNDLKRQRACTSKAEYVSTA